MDNKNVRNFCIIAHIDHGKSTLADRLIEHTKTVEKRNLSEQLLDSMDLEKERGITIKLSPVRMKYNLNGQEYILNLIDTPGHVDFTYEVSRSLAACEGAILIVDCTQGVEAQTLANLYLALDNNLEILPVINKIDLPAADIEGTKREITDICLIDDKDIPCISAKEGTNIEAVLNGVIKHFPPPSGKKDAPLQALIFDSFYDQFKGAVCLICIKNGQVKIGTKIKMMHTGAIFDVTEVGIFAPKQKQTDILVAGDIGYVCASIKNISQAKVGDTITELGNETKVPLKGYKEVAPVVFCGIYAQDGKRYGDLKEALEKLKLNDSALTYTQENSAALGWGFRCGFLGLLHLEIITERIEREFNIEIVATAPSVNYIVHKTDGNVLEVSNPTNLPPAVQIQYIEEPVVQLSVFTPPAYTGAIMQLCQERRGEHQGIVYLDKNRVKVNYIMPLNEIVFDFFDQLKSRTKGYASMEYEPAGYQKESLTKVDIMLNGEICDALSLIVHRESAYRRGSAICVKLKDIIPRHLFEIPIQAAIGGKIIARETVKAMRKDVTAKCYGGDISRKRKLLEKQKEGKKRMRQVGSVELPSDAFTSILKID